MMSSHIKVKQIGQTQMTTQKKKMLKQLHIEAGRFVIMVLNSFQEFGALK